MIGCCPVKMVVEEESRNARYADIIPDDATALKAGRRGAAQIIHMEGGTGSLWAYVRLGLQSPTTYTARLSGELANGKTVKASIGDETVTIDGKWIPDGVKLTGDIGVFFNGTDGRWYPMVSGC
jgi:hypothetical protein